ncbi:39S ribosomal protein L9, mitochondrial [Orchesella cincta]|uniref:Large ribosomal subunit protein bL9m n=1 Tax=Orchesella cincta TaxID=48709 RepID=A0A1D2MPD9_ORCCI|nr:39S ribosomal protein L9, mitochondrial [Orchesella cincta]
MALNACRRLTIPCISSLNNFQQVRTTYVVKRRNPVGLTKPHKMASLRARHFVYETVEDNMGRPQRLMKILLRKYVEDVGQAGEVVDIKEQTARLLIMTNKAAYATQENFDRFGQDVKEQVTYSSKYAVSTMQLLSKFVLNVSMNKETPWTLEPWHIRSSFRKAKVHVTESAITMPEHVITGPDMALEGKEFYVTLTINGSEKVTVRCRIHHWATSLSEKLPRVRDHWKFPVDPIFSEDKKITKALPEIIPPVFDEDDNFIPPVRKATAGRK